MSKEKEKYNDATIQSKSLSFSKEQYDKCLNVLFIFMIILTILGIYLMGINIQAFAQDLQSQNTAYRFPKLRDFTPILYIFPLVLITKTILEAVFIRITPYILAKKYKDPSKTELYQVGQMYIKKLAIHMSKLTYYTFISVLSYYTLSQVDYFPKSLGGNGSLPNMFLSGYPNSFYHYKPQYFDLCHLIGFAYMLNDIFHLLFVYERQSDFVIYFLHHLCTVGLMVFSFLVNYSQIGAIVLFIHNVSDIFVHLTRILLQTDAYEIIRTTSTIVLTITMIYTRLFVLADVIYTGWNYTTWKWEWVTLTLWSFLVFLYIMHLNWTFVLLTKIWEKIVAKKSIDDYATFVKEKEKEKDKDKDKDEGNVDKEE